MTSRWKRTVLAILIGSSTIVGPATATASDDTSNNDNVSIVINTEDDTRKFRVKVDRTRVSPGEDDPDNAAWAQSSCERCKSTAIAIQIVLLERPVDSDFQPTNLAFAINQQCTECETVALAHQVIREVDPNVVISENGKERIAVLVDRIRGLRDDGLTPPELDARVGGFVDQIKVVLDEELRPRGDYEAEDSRDMDAA
jgi:hypothetical protein